MSSKDERFEAKNDDLGKEQRRKRSYRAPRLEVYGDLSDLTAGGGGTNADGKSNPNTKATSK